MQVVQPGHGYMLDMLDLNIGFSIIMISVEFALLANNYYIES